MPVRVLYFVLMSILISLGCLSCSPVKFKAKSSTDPGGGGGGGGGGVCTNESCVDPGPGPFEWRTTQGNCSQLCGGGKYQLTVVCVNQDNVMVPDANCKAIKPSSIGDACNTQTCPPNDGQAHWYSGGFGSCVPACGAGIQTQTVECRDSSGVRPDSACTEAKPPTMQNCNTTCTCSPVNKSLTQTVPGTGNKVDILLVLDDSSSMTADNQKLAQKLFAFGNELLNSNIDWQMCITTTDVGYYEGRPIVWSGTSSRVINKNTPNIGTVFQQTVADIGSGFSNDEQGIKASVLSILNNPMYPCYRPGAAFASIIISDEDERSVGGNSSLSSQQYQPLGVQNQPATFINTAKTVLGSNVRMVVNSIVVKDNSCKQVQDTQGSLSFIGTKYMELSNLTDGHIGSICDADYSANLKYFKDAIVSSVSNVTLECAPTGTPTINLPVGYTYSLNGNNVIFNPALPAGTTFTINYQCCP